MRGIADGGHGKVSIEHEKRAARDKKNEPQAEYHECWLI
jgi:hypothetical protein